MISRKYLIEMMKSIVRGESSPQNNVEENLNDEDNMVETVSNKGKRVWNDGEKNVMAFEQPGPEFVLGRLKPEDKPEETVAEPKVAADYLLDGNSNALKTANLSPMPNGVSFFKVSEHAEIPRYETGLSAGFDFRACLQGAGQVKGYNLHNREITNKVRVSPKGESFLVLHPGVRYMIPTGLIADIQNPNHAMMIYPRSGASLKTGLIMANNVGVIDSDYVNEIFILAINSSDTTISVEHGQRIAQGVIHNISRVAISESDTAPSVKTDRNGGLGSTGSA